ncbi:response regulator [Magnetofaba australis]|nr:response regulator [Magnetofaba australis]
MSALILIVDDEIDLVDTLEYNLRAAQYQTRRAHNGRDALRLAAQTPLPDLILLDLMLPGISGLDVCRSLRDNERLRNIPVLMLTARGESADHEAGFLAGADDYVVKPFSVREVLLRVQAVLRRSREYAATAASSREILFGKLRIDRVAHKVWVGAEEIRLTFMEFKLLVSFLEQRGRLLTRDILLDEVWGITAAVQTRTIDTHVKRLRQKLGEAGDYIETLRGAGYRFIEHAPE